MKQRLKRPLALLMTIVMLLGLLPTAAFAVEEPGEPAMVTVKEAEPVTPSENSEPEDGQEPPTDSTPEDDQTPGNDNANEEPGSNDLNDGEPLLPVDNSGLEPGEPDGGDSVPQADSTAEITSLTLINFTPHGETGSSNVDLLKKTDTDKAVQWDLFNSYALQVSVTVPAGNKDNTFTLTLPHGMKFVNLNTSNLEQTDGIAEAQYEKDEQIANFIPVDGESGTLTVVFEGNAQQVTFSVLVQPDVAFFPLENKSEGWLISNAIQATLTCGENVQIEKIIPVDVQINADIDLDAMYFSLRIGDISDSTPDVAPGEEYRLGGNVWTGWINYNGRQNYRLRSKVVVILSVPKELTVKQIASWWKLENQGADPNNPENVLWKLSAENVWNTTPSFVNQISVTVPKDAKPGTAYEINQVEIAVTTYGQEHPWKVGAPDGNRPIWTLTVRDPDKVQVSFQTGNTTNVYDFTNQSTESGEPFTDYNTSFAGVKLTNDGVGDITEDLIYKAEFEQDVQFVTAVGIPCGWDATDNTWLPTKITIHTDADKVYTISADGSNYSAIRKVASLAYAGKGFILRASDIDGLAPTESITSVEVELPGLPKGYASSNYFLTEDGGANNAYAGVWGRVRENCGENATDENVFSLRQGSEAEEALVSKTVATNITESGKLSVATPSSQIKIKDKSSAAASANDIVHIRQSIEPNRAHGSFHDAETLLYDPVIYLFEPNDLSIENVTFSIETANGKKIENLSYTVDRISGSIENLSNAYSEVYQYTLSDKVMLGWWSGDWDAVTLYVDFDYRVAPAAKTNAYDLRDMIFYKSSLNFTMTNNGLTDQYNLNDGSTIGGVASKIFTVQAASTFNVATAIQIDGENKWYSYNPEDKANTTSVFTEGATANVKITVTNNSGATANNAEVYIPIPKKNSDILDEHFISQAGFDMFLAGDADLTSATGWTVKYGQVAEVTFGENDVPTGDFTLQDGGWSDSYDDNTNMVKLTLSGSMANGTSAEIILKFKATENTRQTDSMNIFKSWYKYSTQNASIVDAEKVYNFGTLLQNGKLNGTVYLDANRNGEKDDGEIGIEDVTVKVTDSEGRTYETQTGEDGAYSFNSLPGNKTLTLTVTNPSSPDPNNSGGSCRFHALNASAGGNIGSDVTPAEDNRSASKREFTLEAGTATVNAGLITPYKVEFKTDSQDGLVSPTSTYIYADTKLSEVVDAVYVVFAGSGRTFTNQWKVGEDATDLIDHEELLDQTVTADTTFTAITSTAQCVVTFQSGAGQFTGDDAAKESITKNYDLNDTISSSDFPTVTHPQGNRLIGWTYNGKTNTAEGWNNTPVTTDMTFTAQFAGDVTLTLIANGGTFAQGARTTFTGAAGTKITIPTPTRTGWTFAGWYTAETGGAEIENTVVLPAASANWYAHWIKGELTVTVTETPTYDGTAKTPALTVKVGSITLNDGDYVAIYKDNVNAGNNSATVTVYGIGDYAGLSGTATFTINKANQTVTFAKPGKQTAIYGETFANTATAKLDSANAKITYSSSDTSIATVDTNTGEVTILKAGEVTITATAAGTSNVNEGKAEYKLTINKANPTLTFANSAVSVKTTGSVSNTLFTEPKGLTVTYTSSNPSVATVNSSTGEITLVGEGTATITATFAEDEKYNEAKASYTLTVDNDAIAYTAEGWYGTHDGTPRGITVNVTTPADGATVTYKTTEDGNYSDQKPTYTNAGNYTVYFKIDAKGYDTVTGSAKVIIEKAQLTEATVTGGPYTGQAVGSVTEVKAGELTGLEKDKDYTVTFNDNVNAGENTAMAVIMGTGNFDGTLIKYFTITPKQLTSQMVSPIADQPYTGDQIKPTVTVEDGTTPLVEGKDFTVTYGDNNTVGTNAGTVTITGIGNYAGTVPKQFNITNSGTFEVIVDNSTLTYDGTEKKPAVTVWAVSDDGNTKTLLTVGTDYEVAYADNTNAGIASVTVTGKGAYTESGKSWKDTTAYFTIQPAEQSVAFASAEVETTYGDPAFTQAATVTLNPEVEGQTPGAVTYASSNPAVATVDSTGKVTIVGAGTATITASAAATQNYKGAEASYTLTVKPKNINSADVTASKIPDQPYGGIPVTPDFSLTDSDSDITKCNLEVNVDYTFTYSNNNGEGEGKITITGKGNYTGTKEVTFQIIPWSESQVVVTPAPITIYMGGVDGYEHVIVDEDTGEIKASSSLPEPGFLFDLPDMLEEALKANDDSLTDIKFYELASNKEWTVEPYAEGSSTVYRLVPGDGQTHVRVQFTNSQGETVTEDQFDVGKNVNQELTMTLYKGKVGVINAIYDGVQYPIQLGESTLTVRGVTDEAQYATVTGDATAPVEGKPAVTAESGTSYTINGSDVPVEDASGVALLFDSIIDASGEDRTSLLENKAEDTMAALNKEPANGNRFAYSFQYLDLVDTNNGNAWVKASKDVTIFWPYPAGTNKDTAFTLLHFEGLHREMDTTEIGDQIANCTVGEVNIVKKTDTHIVLKVGSAGFSPFALVWEEKIPTPPPVNPNPPADPDDTGVSSLLETKEHIQYLAGYPDNSFGPGHNMTRAEAAQMFYNLLVDKEVKITTAFEDVPENAWYATPVNTLASLGIISGVGDNRFEPDRSITRAEFTALAMKFTVGAEKEENIFSDVKPTDWFYEAVTGSIQFGWINGYGDGTFRPNNTITRAEVTAIVNKMLGREGDQAFIQQHQEELKRFTDVTSAHWAYHHIVEATNEHDYTKQGDCEKWSSSSYEK